MTRMQPSPLLLLLTTPLVLAAFWTASRPEASSTTPPEPVTSQRVITPVDLPTCQGSGSTAAKASERPEVRSSAQRGLDFLAHDTVAWQQSHSCYGCHVQAVTLNAMAVGKHHQYDVSLEAMETVKHGMLDLPGGSRTKPGMGLHHGDGIFLSAARSLGGAALARYDDWIGGDLRDDLLLNAELLLQMQTTAGHIANDYTGPPVAIGALQDTVLAMSTWSQAHARTADDRWLTAIASAERWLHQQVTSWATNPPDDIQQLNYVLLGLHEAGTGPEEPVVSTTLAQLLARQHEGGGWALSQHGAPDAYATGQTLYTLRTFGMSDTEPVVARGTDWLLSHQGEDGGWSHGGSARAEAMWGVLGLVSVDVLSVSVAGIQDGQHADGSLPIQATALDNEGHGVSYVEVRVDDIGVARTCGAELVLDLDVGGWADGSHLIDIVAVNNQGDIARRRMEVYTGPHYITRVGSRWDEGATTISMRDIAPSSLDHTIDLSVFAATEDGEAGELVTTQTQRATAGPVSFTWDGTRTEQGSLAPDGRYVATLTIRDPAGSALHKVDHVFVHDTPDAQVDNWAQITGRLSFAADDADAAGAVVELVDKRGLVVGSTKSTRNGQYRFKNIAEGDYEVRVRKDGFAPQAAPVRAAAGKEGGFDAKL